MIVVVFCLPIENVVMLSPSAFSVQQYKKSSGLVDVRVLREYPDHPLVLYQCKKASAQSGWRCSAIRKHPAYKYGQAIAPSVQLEAR
jgi:hypothetical protein